MKTYEEAYMKTYEEDVKIYKDIESLPGGDETQVGNNGTRRGPLGLITSKQL